MTIIERIYDLQIEVAESANDLTEIQLSVTEWCELYLAHPEILEPPQKPLPPIKASGFEAGLFSYGEFTEYDYHAPEYLESVEKWKIAFENWYKLDKNNIDFIGPYGIIKLTKE